MCLAVPAKVESIEGNEAKLNLSGNIMKASLDLLTDVKVGDYVLLHAGYAIQKIDEEEAHNTLELMKELGLTNQGAL
jgi:hydrogenase expression/formation protein HypC